MLHNSMHPQGYYTNDKVEMNGLILRAGVWKSEKEWKDRYKVEGTPRRLGILDIEFLECVKKKV